MATPSAPTPLPRRERRSRRWLRRIVWGVSGVLLLLALFHRPIVHHGGRWLAIRLAARANLALDLRLAGNLWSGLEILDLRATATGPAPIEKLTLDRVAVGYDLLRLVRGDFAGLRRVEIGTLDAVVTPEAAAPAPAATPTAPGPPLAQRLRDLLARPLPTPGVRLVRADVRVRQRDGDLVVRGFHFSAGPGAPGALGWERIEVPGVPALEAARGETSLSGERFAVTALRLFPELALERVAVSRAGGIELAARIAEGSLALSAKPAATGSDFIVTLSAGTLSADPLAARFGAKLPARFTLTNAKLDLSVAPERLADAQLSLALAGTAKTETQTAAAPFALDAKLKGGRLEIAGLSARFAGAKFEAAGTLDVSQFLASERPQSPQPSGQLVFTLGAPDLAPLGAEFRQPLRGALEGKGTLAIADGRARLDATLNASAVAASGLTLGKAATTLRAELPLAGREPLRALVADLSVALEEIEAGPPSAVKVDHVRATANLRDLRATLSELLVQRGANSLRASGTATLDASGQLAAAPGVTFQLDAPALAEFGVVVNGAALNGALVGEGRFALDVAAPGGAAGVAPAPLSKLAGSAKLEAKSLRLGDAPVGDLALELDVADGAAIVKRLAATLGAPLRESPPATLAADARIALAPPHAYAGSVNLNAPALAAFAPLAAVFGVKDQLGGRIALEWKGSGDLTKHDGSAQFAASAVRFGTTLITEAKLAANYSPDKAETTDLLVVADKLRATGKLAWAGNRLEVSGLEVRLANEPVLTGSLSAPLDPRGKQPVARDQPVAAKLDATKLDLGKIFAALGKPPPATGIVSAKLDASGTLAQPVLALEVEGRRLAAAPAPPRSGGTAKAAPPLAPFDFSARLTHERDVARLTGTVRHPELKPLTFSAEVPLAVAPLLDGAKPDLAAIPLQARVELPASSLAFARKLAPNVRQLDGTVALDVRASGTVAAPRFDGTAALDVKLLRLDGALPSVTNLVARLTFAGDTLTFARFGGETGGGKFSLGGKVNLAKPADPVFDLALKADDVLALRDDSILVRADADVTLRGPLSAAAAGGTVFVTQSRFNKEVEILPLALPGRPKPAPRAVAQRKTISFPEKPLRDWKFDLAVKTRPDDPFRIRGNLARGEVALDVRLAGTGLAPYLTGAATIEKFRASLPVSTLHTRRGLVTFSQEAPFEPRLDIEAETVVRRHTIVARVDGMAAAPRLDLSSEPPLPQGEILSLLTTGSLTGEIGANSTAMATRLAILVVQRWYKKLFKRDLPASSDEGGDALLDRFEVELGGVDARTGQNEMTAQFRATDNLFFLGDLDLRGGFTGRVKYLIRFR